MTTITRIDHIGISVVDFPAALRQYSSLLGFSACAESHVPGQRAALFALSNARILLLEAADVQGAGQVLSALALAGADARSCIEQLRTRAIEVTPVPGTASCLNLPDQPSAEVWELAPQHTRGLPLRIVDRAEHRRASLPAADSFSSEQVEALDHIVVRSADLDHALSLYRSTLGLRLALDRELAGTRMLFFRSAGVTLEFVAANDASGADAFYGVAFRVRDLQAAHLRLTAAGFALTEPRAGRKAGTQVFSTRSSQELVPTLFIRDPARDKP